MVIPSRILKPTLLQSRTQSAKKITIRVSVDSSQRTDGINWWWRKVRHDCFRVSVLWVLVMGYELLCKMEWGSESFGCFRRVKRVS